MGNQIELRDYDKLQIKVLRNIWNGDYGRVSELLETFETKKGKQSIYYKKLLLARVLKGLEAWGFIGRIKYNNTIVTDEMFLNKVFEVIKTGVSRWNELREEWIKVLPVIHERIRVKRANRKEQNKLKRKKKHGIEKRLATVLKLIYCGTEKIMKNKKPRKTQEQQEQGKSDSKFKVDKEYTASVEQTIWILKIDLHGNVLKWIKFGDCINTDRWRGEFDRLQNKLIGGFSNADKKMGKYVLGHPIIKGDKMFMEASVCTEDKVFSKETMQCKDGIYYNQTPMLDEAIHRANEMTDKLPLKEQKDGIQFTAKRLLKQEWSKEKRKFLSIEEQHDRVQKAIKKGMQDDKYFSELIAESRELSKQKHINNRTERKKRKAEQATMDEGLESMNDNKPVKNKKNKSKTGGGSTGKKREPGMGNRKSIVIQFIKSNPGCSISQIEKYLVGKINEADYNTSLIASMKSVARRVQKDDLQLIEKSGKYTIK